MQENAFQSTKYDADKDILQTAKWITHPCVKENTLAFERRFSSEGVRSARLIVCGLGFFEAYVNGKRIDRRYFMPAFTDYEKRDASKNRNLLIGDKQRVFVLAYEVGALLQGQDTLRILVGNGYYHNVDRPEEPYVSYGDKKLIFALRLQYADRDELLVSDETVSVQYLSHISGLYNGDYVDFSAETEPFVSAVEALPVCSEMQITDAEDALGDRLAEIRSPISVTKLNGGFLYDFGINHSGGLSCRIQGERGRKVTVKFAEVLYDDGTPNYETGRWAEYDGKGALLHQIEQSGTYVLSGGADEIKPSFSWQCYRYAYVENADGLQIEDMKSYFIHMDLRGNRFVCGNALLNEIHEKSRRTALCNLHAGILSDCPHREKRSYTGDGGIMAETLLYDLHGEAFLSKWLDDILGAQTADGFIPYTVPYISGGGGYAWSNVIATLPTLLYRTTGKTEYLQKSYPAIVKWLGYYKAHSVQHIIHSGTGHAWCLGDWLAPEITEFYIPFMHTLCYYVAADAALFCATVLQNGDADKWARLKADIADAINDSFFNKEKMNYCRGIQGENVLPLAFGIVPKEYEAKLKEKVFRKYTEENGYHLDTGIVSTPIVLEYLTENGMADVAYRMMTATDYPSYAYMLDGETTLSEHWSKRWPDYHICNSDAVVKGGGHLSHCHPMFGSVVAWLYKRVAGLDLSMLYKRQVRFTPRFTKWIKSGSATVETPFGEASISWRAEEKFVAELHVPNGLNGWFELDTDKPLTVETEDGQKRTYIPKNGRVEVLLPYGINHIGG